MRKIFLLIACLLVCVAVALNYHSLYRYVRINLNPNPTPLDMSLLDNDELLKSEKGYGRKNLLDFRAEIPVKTKGDAQFIFLKQQLAVNGEDAWIKTDCYIKANSGMQGAYLNTALKKGDSAKLNKVRLFNAISKEGKSNRYTFYTHVPDYFSGGELRVYISKNGELDAVLQRSRITLLEK